MITKAKLLWSLIKFSTIHFRSNFGDHFRSGIAFGRGSFAILHQDSDSGARTDVTQVTFKDQAQLEQMKEKASEDLTVQITYK